MIQRIKLTTKLKQFIINDVKSEDDKFTKATAPRKTKSRDSDDITNNDETTEKLPSSETVDTNESEEAENNESELAQTFVKNKRIS